MLSILKNLTFIIFSFTAFLLVSLPSNAAALDCANPQTAQEQLQCGACHGSGVNDAGCGDASTQSTDSINNTITNVINIASIIAGVIAVLMLIYGGVRYVTSSGNEQAVSGAKKTIIYAVIGLIIVALAQVVVKFTLSKATQTSSGSGSSQTGGIGSGAQH